MNRPAWAESSDLLRDYYDHEWGLPVHDDAGVYERLVLEGFQAGLSWSTILAKRDAFRAAFAGFDPARVAAFTEADVARLLADPGIVRNEQKIRAAIGNARATVALQHDGESLAALVWSFRPADPTAGADDPPASSPESVALAAELKRRGFVFVGPTTVYAAMQAIGVLQHRLPPDTAPWGRAEAGTPPGRATARLATARRRAVEAALAEAGVRTADATWTVRDVLFRDGSLGCPQPGQLYPQALVPGQQVLVTVGGVTYDFRFGRGDTPLRCTGPAAGLPVRSAGAAG